MSDLDDLLDPGIKENPQYPGNGSVPNAGGILALGIISIVTCWILGVPGIVCGIIAISMHMKAKQLYLSNPPYYEKSYRMAQAGQICGIIGLSLSGLYFFYSIIRIANM